MGLFSGLLGNASQKDIEKTERQLEDILTTTENVELAFSLIRDLIVFTDKRLILVDKQGMTGKKTSYKSFPYRSISRFSVETENLGFQRSRASRSPAIYQRSQRHRYPKSLSGSSVKIDRKSLLSINCKVKSLRKLFYSSLSPCSLIASKKSSGLSFSLSNTVSSWFVTPKAAAASSISIVFKSKVTD